MQKEKGFLTQCRVNRDIPWSLVPHGEKKCSWTCNVNFSFFKGYFLYDLNIDLPIEREIQAELHDNEIDKVTKLDRQK